MGNKSFILLSFYLPEPILKEYLKTDSWPQVQTSNFLKRLVNVMNLDTKKDISFLSTAPVTDYPSNKRKMFFSKKHKFGGKIIQEVGFINLPIIKIITRSLNFLFLGFKAFINKKNKPDVICFSIHIPILLSAYVLSRFYKVKMIGIWTDPPNVENDFDNFLKKYLRGVEASLAKYLMSKADVVIGLTRPLVDDFSSKNAIKYVVNGFGPNEISEPKVLRKTEPKIITHVGSLMVRYGIKEVIESFKMVERNDAELHFYGVGDSVDYIKESSIEDSRIKYKGFIEPIEVKEVLEKKSDFLINVRDPDSDLVKYSFPSKMFDYLASGTPIISSILPSFNAHMTSVLIPVKNYNINSIKTAIETALDINPSAYKKLSIEMTALSEELSENRMSKKILSILGAV